MDTPLSEPGVLVTPGGIDFETFWRASREPIARALSITLGDAQLGSEAADEAMVRAYQRWRKVQTYGNPRGWVYRVGLNWARSRLRKRSRETLGDTPERSVTAPTADPELARALAALPIDHRAVVVLRYLLDWPVEETASALDIAPGTVKSRLSRALDRLRVELAGEEIPR